MLEHPMKTLAHTMGGVPRDDTDKVRAIELSIKKYHQALNDREDGVRGMFRAFDEIERIIGLSRT